MTMNANNKSLLRKLALCQIKINRKRTVWTLLGIVLSASMLTAVFGFAASGAATITDIMGGNEFYTDMYNRTIFAMAAVFIFIIIMIKYDTVFVSRKTFAFYYLPIPYFL